MSPSDTAGFRLKDHYSLKKNAKKMFELHVASDCYIIWTADILAFYRHVLLTFTTFVGGAGLASYPGHTHLDCLRMRANYHVFMVIVKYRIFTVHCYVY